MAQKKRGEAIIKDTRPTSVRQKDFLQQYERFGNIEAAVTASNVPRRTYYNWMESASFQKRFAEAKRNALSLFEDEAQRRGMQGVDKPIFYKGKKIATVKEYSDNLLMFLMKAMAPDKYKDRVQTEHSGVDGKPIEVNNTVTVKATLKL